MKSLGLLFFIMFWAYRSVAFECGSYSLQGIVREENHSLILVVNEKTNSEVKFSFDPKFETKFAAFINRPVKANIEILKKFDGKNGILDNPSSVELRVPDPTKGALDTFIKLSKKMDCK